MNDIKTENSILREDMTYLDAQYRRDNLCIFGLDEAPGKPESCTECAAKVWDCMKAKLKMERCHRLGRPTGSMKSRAVIVKFAHSEDQDLVWKAHCNLQGSDMFVGNHYPREIDDRRARLMPI